MNIYKSKCSATNAKILKWLKHQNVPKYITKSHVKIFPRIHKIKTYPSNIKITQYLNYLILIFENVVPIEQHNNVTSIY